MTSEEYCFCDSLKLEGAKDAKPGVYTFELLDQTPILLEAPAESRDPGFFISNELVFVRCRIVGAESEIHTSCCTKKNILGISLLCDNKEGKRCRNIPATLRIHPETTVDGNIMKLVFHVNVPTVRIPSTAFGCYTIALLLRCVYIYTFSHSIYRQKESKMTLRARTNTIMVFEDEDTLADWKLEPTYPELGSDTLKEKTKRIMLEYARERREQEAKRALEPVTADQEASPTPCKRQCVTK